MGLQDLLFAVALPALLAGAVWFALALPLSRDAKVRPGAAVAFAVAAICAFLGLGGPVSGPDVFVILLYVLGGAGIAGAIDPALENKKFLRFAFRWLVALAAVRALRGPQISSLSIPGQIIEIVPEIIIIVLSWTACGAAVASSKGIYVPGSLWLIFSFGAAVIALTGNLFLGKLSGSLAAAAGPALVLGLWLRTPLFSSGAVGTALLIFFSLLLTGYYYGELPLACALLLAAAPAVALAGQAIARGMMPPRRAQFISLAAAAALCGIALFLGWPAASEGY